MTANVHRELDAKLNIGYECKGIASTRPSTGGPLLSKCAPIEFVGRTLTTMANRLLRLQTLHEYGAERVHVFPSKTSMTWFLRQHRSELIEIGALLMISGRWFVDPDKFDSYVLVAGGRAAAARASRDFE